MFLLRARCTSRFLSNTSLLPCRHTNGRPLYHLLTRHQQHRGIITSTIDWKPIKTGKSPNDDSKRKGSFGKKIVLGLMIAMPVISFYLGTWQMRRLKWKTKLIAACESKLTYDPIPLPKTFTPEMCEDWEYRKVILSGHFLHSEEMFVGPRKKNGEKGYLLFTPFILDDTGDKLLIERGWISEEKVAPESRNLHHLSLPQEDHLKLVCLVRPPKARGSLQWAKKDPNSRLWQVPDIYDMAKTSGCKPIQFQALYDMKDHPIRDENSKNAALSNQSTFSFWKFWKREPTDIKTEKKNLSEGKPKPEATDQTIEFNEWQFIKAGVPIGRKPTIDLKNNHLQYLVTWYGLSLLSTIFLAVALAKAKKGGVVSQDQLIKDKLKHTRKYM
ncbi:cytochrome oxidase assembly protein SHY1 [Saccharomyces eubayanus]|uniref:cytochrome oxidase assembly protein SHY1 n=1 Tax=Saccharomyces eubayanus TaxID=1080349 RepID=UPI0006C601B0|nr:SHY1-like protein [Saccharomyces eubayanus]KOG99604.1 SHY1-like protein [Saccharomyces eubayanus]